MLVWIELALTAFTIVLAFWRPQIGASTFNRIETAFRRLARRPHLAVMVVGLAAIAARLAVLPLLPFPQPRVTDEYSQLLLVDTLLHRRVTNPTPDMWTHFETFQVNMRPTYASMYPPAQGIALAAGHLLTGHAFWGVLFSIGTMCAALCWMLQGWVPAEWALAGGFLAIARLATFSYWSDTYWGAPVAATGGALILGALPRIVGWASVRRQGGLADWQPPQELAGLSTTLAMGLGLAILANVRPYEGLILSVPVGIALLAWLIGKAKSRSWDAVTKVVVPLGSVLLVTAVLMCFYFWRVTGSAWEMPQQLNRATYAEAPYFIWQPAHQIAPYRHAIFHRLYTDFEMGVYLRTRSLAGLLAVWILHIASLWAFFFGPILTLPVVLALSTIPVGLSWSRISAQARFLIALSLFCMLGLLAEVFLAPHYAAPMTGLALLLLVVAMRRIRTLPWRNMDAVMFITRGVFAVIVLMLVVRICAAPLHVKLGGGLWNWGNAGPYKSERAEMQSRIESSPGSHLVIVRLDLSRPDKQDLNWVYNGADLNASRIIWAWDMGASANQELLDAYKGRKVWLLQPDADTAHELIPYTTEAQSP